MRAHTVLPFVGGHADDVVVHWQWPGMVCAALGEQILALPEDLVGHTLTEACKCSSVRKPEQVADHIARSGAVLRMPQ